MIKAKYDDQLSNILKSKCHELGMGDNELKWGNVTPSVLNRYMDIIDIFFRFIKDGDIKVRIMFTDNRFTAHNLTIEHKQNEYHLLYYQFVKWAFGLMHIKGPSPIDLKIHFDAMPEKEDRRAKFKDFIWGLQYLPDFLETNISIRRENIYEVDSKKHVLLQCLDIVLGSMAFRLNNMHKEKPPGGHRRGKRTKAKELLYKRIKSHLLDIRPGFNIGITTGTDDNIKNIFYHPYRHWLFIPKQKEME